MMIQEELINWFRLYATYSIGPVTFSQLISKFKTATRALEELPEISKRLGKSKPLQIATTDFALNYFNCCAKAGVSLIPSCSEHYPKNLKQISDAPPLLHVKGSVEILNKHSIAVVGSRNASIQGVSFAQRLCKNLCQPGVVIISGLARGIDSAAHKTSLETGTIAVLAGGVDMIYPPENEQLYNDIIANGGAIISEGMLGKEPKMQAFTYRNRIISGISNGVIVVEAAVKSGSLITAQYASQQGRDVFAVPGHPYDPRAAGANYLLKNGAILVETAQDVLEHKNSWSKLQLFQKESEFLTVSENLETTFDDEDIAKFLLEKLGTAEISVNEIVKQLTQYSVANIQWALAELEIAGLISIERNYIRRI